MKSLPAFPLAALLVFLRLSGEGQGLGAFLVHYYRNPMNINLVFRVRELLVFDNYFLRPGHAGENIALFFTFFVMLTVFFRYRHYLTASKEQRPKSRAAFLYPVLILPLALFFFLPYKIPGHDSQYVRFTGLFFLGLIVWGSLWGRGSTPRFRLALIAVVLAHFLLWADCFIDFNRENRGFDREFFPQAADGKVLTGAIFQKRFRRLPAYIHFPDYYIIWRQGIAATALLRYGYVIFDNDLPRKPLPAYDEFILPDSPLAEENFRTDYLLVSGEAPDRFRDFLAQRFRLLKHSGQWRLYERGEGR
jgi:hypothetical protein